MKKRWLRTWILAFCVSGLGVVFAHEGHSHRIRGTVSVIHENHLEVKTRARKTSVITLTEKTKVLRGTSPLKLADIKAGQRVVVTAMESKGQDGKTTLIAKRVSLGSVATPAKK